MIHFKLWKSRANPFNIVHLKLISTLSLKHRPHTDAEAVDAVRLALKNLALSGKRVLVVIHGYGSGGAGGSNREAIRAWLAGELSAGRVRRVIPGERLTSGDISDFKRRYHGYAPDFDRLRKDAGNEGVTILEC